MEKDIQQKDLESRVQELLTFAKDKEIFIGACQEIDKAGRIQTTPLYKDLKKYDREVEFKTTSDPTGTPFPEELK